MLIQFFNAYNCRSDRLSVFRQPFVNRWLNTAVAWELVLLVMILYVPFLQRAFGTFSMTPGDWMLTTTLDELDGRRRRMLRRLRRMLPASITLAAAEGTSSPGGGSFPLLQLPTRLIELSVSGLSANSLETALRATDPPVVGRIQRDRFMLDLRTLNEADLPLLASALLQALEHQP